MLFAAAAQGAKRGQTTAGPGCPQAGWRVLWLWWWQQATGREAGTDRIAAGWGMLPGWPAWEWPAPAPPRAALGALNSVMNSVVGALAAAAPLPPLRLGGLRLLDMEDALRAHGSCHRGGADLVWGSSAWDVGLLQLP